METESKCLNLIIINVLSVYSAIFEHGMSLLRLSQVSVDVADDGEMKFIKKCAIANNVQIIA